MNCLSETGKFLVLNICHRKFHIQTYGSHTQFYCLIQLSINCYLHHSLQIETYFLSHSIFHIALSVCFLFLINSCPYHNLGLCSSSSFLEDRGLAKWISAFFISFFFLMCDWISWQYVWRFMDSHVWILNRCLFSLGLKYSLPC